MPDNEEPTKVELRRLKDLEVNSLKGKLVEVRRIGAQPIFVAVTKDDTIKKALTKADIPFEEDEEIKVEAIKPNTKTWLVVKMSDKVFSFEKIAVTTKVKGSC